MAAAALFGGVSKPQIATAARGSVVFDAAIPDDFLSVGHGFLAVDSGHMLMSGRFLFFRGKVAVFTILCEQYQTSLKRDPAYNDVSISQHHRCGRR